MVSGGVAVAGTAGGYSTLPVNRADVEVSFKIVALPSTGGVFISLRDTGTYRYVVNILPNSVRIQRFGPSGNTVLAGMQGSLGSKTLGTTLTAKIIGSTITLTGQGDVNLFTLTGTDTDVTAAGGVGVDMGANSGAKIDDLVVTAR